MHARRVFLPLMPCLVLLQFTVGVGWSADRYVSLTGGDVSPYTNWATAARRIQDAVDVAVAGDVVWVTNGVYDAGGALTPGYVSSNRVKIAKAITVRSVNGPAVTTIAGRGPCGSNAVRCVYMVAGSELAGFTLTNGFTPNSATYPRENSGGGVLMDGGGTVTNCVIKECEAWSAGGGVHGEGVCVISSCVIQRCRADRGGGVRVNSPPWVRVENCIIEGNWSRQEGGGIQVYHGAAVNNCLIQGNSCDGNGGGAHVDWGTYTGSQQAFFDNCTIVGNTAGQNGGVGYIINGGAYRNTIIWGNTNGNWSGGTYTYCCTTPLPTGTGNMTNDPAFVSFAAADYRLVLTSPCIDRGTNFYATGTVDLAGNPRIGNGSVDMGAYEFVSSRQQSDHYVSPTGGDVSPYTNWATAARRIQDAVDVAVAGDVVWVTNGVYDAGGAIVSGQYLSNRVMVTTSVWVRSVNGPESTHIVGRQGGLSNAVRCVYASGGAVVSGFTLTNGAVASAGTHWDAMGAGAHCADAGTVSNCVIRNCDASAGEGGGAYTWDGLITTCVIVQNRAYRGGGVKLTGVKTPRLENCIVRDNRAEYAGGGTFIYHIGTVNNCLIANNQCDGNGGGSFVDYGSHGAFINNCTIAGNTAGQNGGVGYIVNGGAYRNTIIWGNTNGNWAGGTYTYCCTTPLPGGTGNMTNDPAFVNVAAADYRLALTSPCIDRGTNLYATGTVDLAGNPRIGNGSVDMGAYESVVSAQQSDHYVSLTGGNVSPYTNWATAARRIQDAVDVAVAGDVVWVTNGVYDAGGALTPGYVSSNRVKIAKAITVRSVNGPAVTTIAGRGPCGSNAVRCVYMVAGSELAGFTLTNGFTPNSPTYPRENSGGGVLMDGGGTVTNCVIKECEAWSAGGGVHGEGVCVISSCVIQRCRADRGGGVRVNSPPWVRVENCIIEGNWSRQEGGGIQVYHGAAVNNCLIQGNSCDGNGGGAHVDWGTYTGAQQAFFDNCTIVGNTAGQNGGVGYIINGGAYRNTIIWGNTNGNWSGGTYTYCCTTPQPSGTGNLSSDPLLVPGGFDLGAGSPCLNAGNNTYAPGTVDVLGRPRITAGTVDIGAFEVPDVTLVIQGLPAAHGVSSPFPYGTNRLLRWTAVTNTVPSAADEDAGVRYVCAGWTGTGSVPVLGQTNRVALCLDQDSLLNWLWGREFWLELVGANGSVEGTQEGWKPEGFIYDLTPSNAFGFAFDHWLVDGTNAGSGVPLTITSDLPHRVEAICVPVFTDVSTEVTTGALGWRLSRQTGTYFGDFRLCANDNARKALIEPFWYVVASNASLRLMHPDGIEPVSGFPYVDVTTQVVAQLRSVGNSDTVLDPGECVVVTNVEFYSRDRSVPRGFLVAVWADPPGASVIVSEMADTDGDGIPNAWERRWTGLDANNPKDARLDSDGDGYSNFDEYCADTRPDDPASCLRTAWRHGNAGEWILEWIGGVGVTQVVERSLDLREWTDIFTNGPPTPETNRLDLAPDGRALFFRIKIPGR